jgi:hypothetical protein
MTVGDQELNGEIHLHEYPFPPVNAAFWVGGVALDEDKELRKDEPITIRLADGRTGEGKVMEQRDARSVVIAATEPLWPGP